MGLVSVFGNDVETYYEKLLQGESGIGLIDRFDASKLPTRFAGQIRGFSSEGYIDGKNDRRMDDCLRYCLVSGKKALESAGLGVGSGALSKVRFACFVTSGGYFPSLYHIRCVDLPLFRRLLLWHMNNTSWFVFPDETLSSTALASRSPFRYQPFLLPSGDSSSPSDDINSGTSSSSLIPNGPAKITVRYSLL